MIFLLLFTIELLIISLNGANPRDRLPSLWNEAPSSLSDYPLINNCSSFQNPTTNSSCRLIDPWLYLHQLGLYKILINVTTPYVTFCSRSSSLNGCNLLFGLATHLSWQFVTDRLFSNGSRNISVDSWWGSYNYYLSVIPFLAAVDTGFIRQDSFQIVQRDLFCSNFDECSLQAPDAMLQWRTFFLTLPISASTCFVSSICEPRDECYLGSLWLAHNASIQNALPIIETKLSFLPSHNEQRFGLSWVNAFTLIGMARTVSDLQNTNNYQDEFLPNRMLTATDKPPHCPDISLTVNLALQLLFEVPIEVYPELILKWDPATNFCYEQRRYAQGALYNVPLSKTIALIYYELALISPLTC